jgi:hypothetical protein
MGKLSFAELRDRFGAAGGRNKLVLDAIWPDWTAQEKERVILTLQSEFTAKSATIAQADIRAFVDFSLKRRFGSLFLATEIIRGACAARKRIRHEERHSGNGRRG